MVNNAWLSDYDGYCTPSKQFNGTQADDSSPELQYGIYTNIEHVMAESSLYHDFAFIVINYPVKISSLDMFLKKSFLGDIKLV